MAAWVGLVPALLAALYAGWCGNLLGGVTAAGSTAALAALLAMLAFFAGSSADPLRLGRAGLLAPLGLWVAVAASTWVSPVPRAGLAAVALLPAYLFLPGVIARCWTGEAARRLGARGMAAAVAALAAWSLAAGREEGAAGLVGAVSSAPLEPAGFAATLAPLGHHTLLATWLATLLPLALLPLREKTAWRWLGATAGMLGIAAVMAGRSLAGGAALACEALLAALWLAGPGAAGRRDGTPAHSVRRLAAVLTVLGVALAAAQAGRVLRIASRLDSSASARVVYLRAGGEGWRERPWLGWGPGSAAWTAAWFLKPRAGLNPWGEAVGELHSLPVHLAYETGALGLLCALATAGVFSLRRWSERRAAADRGLLAAGCLGLAGAGVAWLGTAALAVPALPFALAAAAGAALAGGRGIANPEMPGEPSRPTAIELPERPAGEAPLPPPDSVAAQGQLATRPAVAEPGLKASPRVAGLSAVVCIYALAAAAALLAPQAARWHYDRAVSAGQAGRREAAASELAAAVRLDPGFPLYRMRLALLQDGTPAGRAAAAALAWRAARDARGVGLLWLVAGILGRADGEAWAVAALEQSCSLDPLAPYPPFYLLASMPDSPAAPRLGARALLAEPRLAAATFWEGREPLFRRVLEEVGSWPGVDAGWRLALRRAAPPPTARRGASRNLSLAIDTAGFTESTSLHLFHRLPWPTLWPLVVLRESLLPSLNLPPATSLPSTNGKRFAPGSCVPGS